jgi:coenzyme F420 hydrogenase subunit beta
MSDMIKKIVDGGMCHGCGACAGALGPSKLKMEMSASGYLRPTVVSPLERQDEAVVQRVCSGQNLHQAADDQPYDPAWGPIASIGTGYSTDSEIRHRGSSGGTITTILIYLLETAQVDFVLQTRADPSNPVGNITTASNTRDDILAAAGSRYAPSAPLEHINDYLQTGQRFAFVGKPCDVASLRMMARIDPRIDQQIPFMLSFFCAGVPSRAGALAVVIKLGVEEPDLAKFEYRGRGWPGLARATRHDGTEASMDYHSSWGSILNRHLQFRCKICPEGTGEFSDIACADAWYGVNGYPDFTERDGRSLVVARTERGRALLDGIKAAGAMVWEPLSLSNVRLMQPYQYDRRRSVLARLCAMVLRRRSAPSYTGLKLWHLALRSSPVWLARNFWGTFRRVRRGEPLA